MINVYKLNLGIRYAIILLGLGIAALGLAHLTANAEISNSYGGV
ncbi:MAG: hypothetical protein RRE78_11020 [Acidianus sp.]|jgi:hypothetical protein|nr:hypothetical protein [Acidianus sp.]